MPCGHCSWPPTLSLPPGLLQSGRRYVLVITALQGGQDVTKAPFYLKPGPWGYADALSGLITP